MKRIVIFLSIFLSASAAYPQSQAEGAAFGPVLTYPEREPDKLAVFLYTEEKEIVGLYVSNNLTNYTQTEHSKQKYHEFRISVKNCTFLYYRVISNNRAIKGGGGTVNLPSASVNRIAAFGNTVVSYQAVEAMAPAVRRLNPQIAVHLGNIVADSINYSFWAKYFAAAAPLVGVTPFAPVVGDRDFYSSIWKQLFDVSNRRNPFYSYKLPTVTLIVLNGSMYFGKDSTQYTWMSEELKRVDPHSWIVVALHQNPLQSASNPVTAELADNLLPLLKQYGVRVVLTGSDYCYERSLSDGIQFVNAGGGGGFLAQGGWVNTYRQFIDASQNTFAVLEAAPNALTVRGYNARGKVIDEVTVRR